jgi:hypothetical protein
MPSFLSKLMTVWPQLVVIGAVAMLIATRISVNFVNCDEDCGEHFSVFESV